MLAVRWFCCENVQWFVMVHLALCRSRGNICAYYKLSLDRRTMGYVAEAC